MNTTMEEKLVELNEVVDQLINKNNETKDLLNKYEETLNGTISSINIDKATFIRYGAFAHCTKLTDIWGLACSRIQSTAFDFCTHLTSVSFPNCESIGNTAFRSCSALTQLSLPKCSYLGNTVFQQCYNLKELYLYSTKIPQLSHSNAFSSTPIAGYTTSTGGQLGSIYVRSTLYESFKAATNWTYYADRFVSVPDEEIDAAQGG